jgi:hypothetical protein
MSTVMADIKTQVKEMLDRGERRFRGMKLPNADFSKHNLENADFRNTSLVGANFEGCNLKYANFEGANCFGANFQEANLYRVNFKDAQLADANLRASELYGITVTLECKTFQGIELHPGHWFGWLFYGLLMKPPTQELEDKLIALMGTERYQVLRTQYARRGM